MSGPLITVRLKRVGNVVSTTGLHLPDPPEGMYGRKILVDDVVAVPAEFIEDEKYAKHLELTAKPPNRLMYFRTKLEADATNHRLNELYNRLDREPGFAEKIEEVRLHAIEVYESSRSVPANAPAEPQQEAPARRQRRRALDE